MRTDSPRLLVISSCTGAKAVSSPSLTHEDFADEARLKQREEDLRHVRRTAADLYTGWQHVYLMRGLRALRTRFGEGFASLWIVSAGYGLIDEQRLICPYDVTFNDMTRSTARDWAQQLGIPRAVREAIRRVEIVVFLLGSRYLDAVDPPIEAEPRQRLIFLAKPAEAKRLRAPGVTLVPAGKLEAKQYGAGLVALKGKMFERFATAVCRRPGALDEIAADDSPGAFLRALGES